MSLSSQEQAWLPSTELAEGRSSSNREESLTHRGEGVAGVGDEHAGLADGAVADRHALDEPCRAHRPPCWPARAAAAVGCGGCLPGLGWSGGYGQVMQGYRNIYLYIYK